MIEDLSSSRNAYEYRMSAMAGSRLIMLWGRAALGLIGRELHN